MTGVYKSKLKNGEVNYRSSFTYKNKHISLASFSNEADAYRCYLEAKEIVDFSLEEILKAYTTKIFKSLPLEKAIIICNFKDNGIYFSNPIYLKNKTFDYYLSLTEVLKFDIDDLFYYSSHKIQRRGGHLFVEDYGMQVTIGFRYGIKPYSVNGRDYIHINGDNLDYRYDNIEIYNKYFGVKYLSDRKDNKKYMSYIHLRGYYTVGYYETAVEAAIAYNKAIEIMKERGIEKNYTPNYIEGINKNTYKILFDTIKINLSE